MGTIATASMSDTESNVGYTSMPIIRQEALKTPRYEHIHISMNTTVHRQTG